MFYKFDLVNIASLKEGMNKIFSKILKSQMRQHLTLLCSTSETKDQFIYCKFLQFIFTRESYNLKLAEIFP